MDLLYNLFFTKIKIFTESSDSKRFKYPLNIFANFQYIIKIAKGFLLQITFIIIVAGRVLQILCVCMIFIFKS